MIDACDYELLTYESKRIRNVMLYAVSLEDVASGTEISDPECVVWTGDLRMLEQELIPKDLMGESCDRFKYTPIQSHNLKIEFFKINAPVADEGHDNWAIVYYNPEPKSHHDRHDTTINSSTHCPNFYYITAQLPSSDYIDGPTHSTLENPIQVALGLRFNNEGDAMEFRESIQAYDRRFESIQDDYYERQARLQACVQDPNGSMLSPIDELATSQTVSNESDFDDSDFETYVSAT